MDDQLGNTARTFFGNIPSVPKVFLMGTLWLYRQDHLKCAENSLPLENCIKIGLEDLQCVRATHTLSSQCHRAVHNSYCLLKTDILW